MVSNNDKCHFSFNKTDFSIGLVENKKQRESVSTFSRFCLIPLYPELIGLSDWQCTHLKLQNSALRDLTMSDPEIGQ